MHDAAHILEQRILKARLFMEEHLDDAPSLDAIAAQAHFSPYHFHRVFTGMVGESVKAHMRRLRLERAAVRLLYSDRPLADIAFEAGYEAQEAFSRAFKALFGEGPALYRKQGNPEFLARGGTLRHDQKPSSGRTLESYGVTLEIRHLAPQRVAFIRHVGAYFECGRAWDTLCAWAGQKGLFTPHTQFMGVSHDDPAVTPSERIRYDACITVGPDVCADGPASITTIEGGDYVCALYRGPYTDLQDVYALLCGQGIPALGKDFANAPAVEVYHNTPEHTAPEDLLTEIRIPVVDIAY
ncbi:AraC family transcriptional regulator [Desulfobaculum xiamenense]|uniref:AraC family transcriptional regulator n=1 Tax=Desulfobaculum xiamenense TaxID=995050 RepID=A0A846QUG3_9BACT|nr:AraC family transcriptional regulator [Desulfobaculum xiamenense]NJB69155.1 AraC family transcriptional regulator [Desulfobaculum xiamenense]